MASTRFVDKISLSLKCGRVERNETLVSDVYQNSSSIEVKTKI